MVTTLVRLAGSLIKGVWRLIEKASRVEIRLEELDHPSLRKMMPHCSGRVPIYVHSCFYRSLKLRYPLEVGDVFRDGRVITELRTGSLRHAVGILTPENFCPGVESE